MGCKQKAELAQQLPFLSSSIVLGMSDRFVLADNAVETSL